MLVANSLDKALSTALESADFYEFGGGWCVPQSLDSLLKTSRSPSTGLFYLIYLPAGWKLAVYRDQASGNTTSLIDFWSVDVHSLVSRLWLRALKNTRLGRRGSNLAMHPRAFPRGRVAWSNGEHRVYHSASLFEAFPHDRLVLERVFGMVGATSWVENVQENCLSADKESVREMLLIEEDWSATEK